MKQETKVIYSAIDSLETIENIVEQAKPEISTDSNAPSIGIPIDGSPPEKKTMCYRDLKKGARDIMELNASNFNELLSKQNYKFPKIENVSFIEFQFGTGALLGFFKASYIDNSINRLVNTTLFASWNGDTLQVFC